MCGLLSTDVCHRVTRQDAMQSAKAQEQLLREQLQEVGFVLSALHPSESVPHSLVLMDVSD